jgi:hypothetical protein
MTPFDVEKEAARLRDWLRVTKRTPGGILLPRIEWPEVGRDIAEVLTRAIAAERERCAAECRGLAGLHEKQGNSITAVWAAQGCALAIERLPIRAGEEK